MKKQALTPCRPYLLRAYYHWLLDNQLTPYLVVQAQYPGLKVPLEAAKEGKVVLNIAPRAVTEFEILMDRLHFSACFRGIPREVVIPMAAVIGIYAHENGAGTLFAEEPAYQQERQSSPEQPAVADPQFDRLSSPRGTAEIPPISPADRRPTLRIIE